MRQDLKFRKMHGCGNDFVIIRNLGFDPDLCSRLAKCLCGLHFGVGSDGLMVLQDFEGLDKPVEIWMFNPDGSDMGMCGNGIRCLTRYLVLEKLVTQEKFTANFNVRGRNVICSTQDAGKTVTVDMGKVSFRASDIPLSIDTELISSPISVLDQTFLATAVSVGNPHCVILVEDALAIDLHTLGPIFEYHELFPKRTNVEFVQVLSSQHIQVRVWERGAGPTLACGTGSCASAVVCCKLGYTKEDILVSLPGGELRIYWQGEKHSVFMTGPTVEVFSGVVEDSYPITGTRSERSAKTGEAYDFAGQEITMANNSHDSIESCANDKCLIGQQNRGPYRE